MKVVMPRYTRLFLLKKGDISSYHDEHWRRHTPIRRYVYERERRAVVRISQANAAEISQWITERI